MKIGIVGNGSIVVYALQCFKEAGIECSALWCRTESKGRAVFDGPVYTDYAEFLKQDFDTVYIGLSNSLHYAYTLEALKAKKNAIVEKPFTDTYAQAKELVDTAKQEEVFLFEAIMSRYNPVYRKMPEYLKQVGNLKLIQCNFSQYSSRYDAYKQGKVLPAFDPQLSGGALRDLNVYNIHFVAGLLGKPESVHYTCNTGFNGVDTSGTLVLQYPTCIAVCTAAKDSRSNSGIIVQGDEGTIEIHSRPGIMRNVTVNNEEITCSSQQPMVLEFKAMQDVIEAKDYDICNRWMEQTLIVTEILEQATPYTK